MPRPFHLPNNRERKRLLLAEIAALLEKRALERVSPQDLMKPAFYSLLFLVPKSNGGFRPVIDVSRLNKFVDCPHFKMETVRSIKDAMRPDDWSISIDLSDAYLHIPLHKDSVKFLRIALSPSEVYNFRTLPFGLNTAPLVFTRVATAVAALLRQRGVRMHVYLDDWLILSQDRLALLAEIPEILSLVGSLGFLINDLKSRLVPAQQFEYLGLHFDTKAQLVRPADHLVRKALGSAMGPSPPSSLSPRDLMRIIGLLGSMADFVPLGRLYLRPVQYWLANRWTPKDGDLDGPLVVTQSLSIALRKWTDPEWLCQGVPLVPPTPTSVLFTDASKWGWGASLVDVNISGVWSPQEAQEHINVLELRAVLNALGGLRNHLHSKRILLLTDNTSCVAYLKKMGGMRSPALCDLTWEIYRLTQVLQVDLFVRHIPSRLNVLADALSRRKPLLTEWTLNNSVFQRLHRIIPHLAVDLFATRLTKQLPLFVSPFPDREAYAADALSIPWKFQGIPYAFPPAKLLPPVLAKIRRDQVPLILVIAPCWPRQAWFTDLLEMTVTNALQLPQIPTLLHQGAWFHQNPELWNLHAWLLSGLRLQPQVSLHASLREWLQLVEPPQTRSTMLSGRFLEIGVFQGRSVLSIPLSLR